MVSEILSILIKLSEVFLGPSPIEVIQQYTSVIGTTVMIPYWALGFHLCRWGYKSIDEVMTVVNTMKAYGIPQDVQWNVS